MIPARSSQQFLEESGSTIMCVHPISRLIPV
jgi:hypothetical protein